jgi:alpha-glucosidase
MKTGSVIAALLTTLCSATLASAQDRQVLASPDGSLSIAVTTGADGLRYAVERKGEAIIAPSHLGLDMTTPAPWGPLVFVGSGHGTIDQTIPLIATKASTARDHYNEMTVMLQEAGVAGRHLNLVLRAYDDGVAFRYVIPAQPGFDQVVLRGEQTRFDFPADYDCWAFNVGRMDTSHEGEFDTVQASQLRNTPLYDMPLACKSASGATSFLIAEADLRDYAGLYLRGRGDGGLGVEAQLSYRSDNKQEPVRCSMTPAGVQSPWRVVLMADRAGDLIASNTIGNLNPAPRDDFSWVHSGKAAWDWWNGPYLPPPAKAAMDTPTFKRFIDFAGASGLEYYLIDEGWSFGSGMGGTTPADADVTREKPRVNMPELVAYAKARNVGLMVWVQWSLLDPVLDKALAQYEAWGLKGIKVDFMDRNDQDMVAFYHRVLHSAAQHHLLVDFHGAYPPTGLNRTWPNYVTQEGVMGAEYNKWSSRVTATHNVTIPFTRMVLGPMDYTPGGMRNRTPATFRVTHVPPQVQTTRGQALAMYVVYDSPLQMVADSPDAYQGTAGFDFIQNVPTSWDETRFIAGEIGQYIALARRKGADWYLGAMTNEAARKIDVPLDFLGTATFSAMVDEDGAVPESLIRRRIATIGRSDVLTLDLAASGGAVARFTTLELARRR